VYVNGADSTFTMNGGTISGNTVSPQGYGGGVHMLVGSSSSFKKEPVVGTSTSGVIYGENENKDSNTAPDNDRGYAVYFTNSANSVKGKRNATAGLGDKLDSTQNGSNGGWD
jgi:hypothetical protein